MILIRRGFAPALLAVVLALTVDAGAQPFDHLECYKIKDLAPKQKYTADLLPEQTQFLAQTGCELKVPAKLFCIDVEKSNVAPVPPLVLNGQNTRDYLCYNLKCPPQVEIPLAVEDQFGTRTIKVKKKPFQLCAPARKIGFPDQPSPTPCLPPATPAPTATPPPSCTDLIQNGGETGLDCGGGVCPPCPNGEGCLAGSHCQSGICMAGVCQPQCMAPFANCDGIPGNGCEINTGSDVNNCGACGISCPNRPNSTRTCNAGTCGFSCNMGFSDCNALAADGCEVNNQTDPANCGGCALFCPSGMCVNGACQLANGSACSFNSQCASNNCVDGVCCNTACAAICEACTAVKKGSGADGSCGFIFSGGDPDNECAGSFTCDGAGMCMP